MPPRQKKPADQAELFSASTAKEIQDILWKAADKLRGSIDAAQYKEFVLGLIFLKYVSDAFEERRTELAKELAEDGISEEQIGDFLEDRDEYTGAHVFWVPETARWSWIAANAKAQGVGKLLDEAMDAIMRENASLTGVLPKIFNQDRVDQKRLGELVDLISDARFGGNGDKPAQDLLGEVYEYFLGNFARAEGKRGGEFYTPSSVVRLIVEILEPYEGRVYDPACGSGGMFVQAAKFIEAHRGRGHKTDISVYGQELNERTWRLAKMNLAIHGIDGNLAARWGDTFADDKHPDLKADFVMANPPFNIKDWARDETDPRWKYGVPPKNNANYAWLQHMISKLGERGTAGIVLANGSMSSQASGEGEIRQALIEADLVACMVALPSQLFRTTQIPACLWFLSKDKSPQGARRLDDRRGEILFIDARAMGEMVDRTERVFSGSDLRKIADTYHAWRGTASAREEGLTYEDVPGFCYSADLEKAREHGYVLTPGRYVGAVEAEEEDAQALAERISKLTEELYELFDKSAELEKTVRKQLGEIGV
ncbi:class I SAM-dependent DNA methyltransferase [Streptomyces griseoloalbus]|uniref:site-specific DNA-methyltransferase (adenine-specific) n=1 Tax=Streptomyces griseoloalbus TaxID=67303 RepID=A0A7W8BTN2_9ACTN|nr:class I SAM-dependent DNA methyltransferase [Streptomyces albaduncus]MBB5129414.1 type I restriction enzyme M protein [Streptomyces albaduncus]GGW66926.1 type I restriction endonuclease subunit M [Streptomyces albaduncus]